MISTFDTKRDRFKIFRTGNPDGKVIFIIGSCRSIPYLNYLAEQKEKFLIYFVDPFDFHWDSEDQLTDYKKVIESLETDENILNIIKSTDIFIHEYYANFGMFNCSKDAEKNIYQFGMNPGLDICIPNVHDCFILFQDFANLDPEFKDIARLEIEQYGTLTDVVCKGIIELGNRNISKFKDNCKKTDFPEVAEIFENEFLKKRFFTSFNHVGKNYTSTIFKMMNEKFLHLDIDLDKINNWEFYENTQTPLTKYDIKYRDIQWDEEIKELQLK